MSLLDNLFGKHVEVLWSADGETQPAQEIPNGNEIADEAFIERIMGLFSRHSHHESTESYSRDIDDSAESAPEETEPQGCTFRGQPDMDGDCPIFGGTGWF